jgi:hypothetical protein
MKTCSSPTGFFKVENLFGELWTEGQKTIARKNLGLTGKGGTGIEEVNWGDITGDIQNQKDLIEFAYQ